MGKLTDSLKATTKKLDTIRHGISQMQELGRELAGNTLQVADAALRTGYAYAKAEEVTAQPVDELPLSQAIPSLTPSVLDADQLDGAERWTEKTLKARFGSCPAAYRHLRDVYGVKLRDRSWKTIIDIFNGVTGDRAPVQSDPHLAQQVVQLEQTVFQQGQRIAFLEEQLHAVFSQLDVVLSAIKGLSAE